MDVFVLSCVCDTYKLKLIQYNCVKISILPYPVNQTPSSPPACLRSLPVLAAAKMTHRRKHTIGDTINSIHTLWSHKPNTGSNIPVAPNYRDGEDLYRTQGINLDHSWTNNKPVYFHNYCLQNNQNLQEIIMK